MEIYLLRHGQTEMNTMHCLQGHTDTVLNDTGIQQAKALHDFLEEKQISFDTVFVSPLKRVIQTAELVTGKNPKNFIVEPRLIEMSFGINEGKKLSDLPDEFFHNFFENPTLYEPPEGAESYFSALHRVHAMLMDIKEDNKNGFYDNKRILLASHGAISHCIVHLFSDDEFKDLWEVTIDNCALIKLDFTNYTYEFIHPGFSRPRYNPNQSK